MPACARPAVPPLAAGLQWFRIRICVFKRAIAREVVIDKALFTKTVALEYRALALGLLSICLMFADNRFDYLGPIRYALAYTALPVSWVADLPARTSSVVDDVLISKTELVEENARLRDELLLAQRELQVMESLTSENSRLLALDEAAKTLDGEVIAAEVINQSPNPASKRVLINRGAAQGVFVGQALLAAEGLMGQVVEVMPTTSWVLLLSDPLHVTPVEVNRNGERALARGVRGASDEVELEFFTQTQDIEKGDLLISSGMGQVFPKNYPVADVIAIARDPGQDFATVRARLRVAVNSTRNVMLINPVAETVAQPAASDLEASVDTAANSQALAEQVQQ